MNARTALPWSPEAEQSVLGALMLAPDALVRLAEQPLQADHFFGEAHRAIWAAITELAATGEAIDQLTVLERLQRARKADDVGGLSYLDELARSVPSAANVTRYAAIVREKALEREVIEAADRAMAIACEAGRPASDKLDAIASTFESIRRPTASRDPQALSELVMARAGHWEALQAGNATAGLPTGLPELDRALAGGFKPGKVITIAARPSVGKTSLAQQLGMHVAAAGHTALFLSQEMPAGDLVDRAVANLGRVNLERIATGALQAEDWSAVSEAVDRAARLPFYVDDRPALTLLDIRAKARLVKHRHGLELVILDYLQLCAASGNRESRHHQIEEISRGLKRLAKELDVCVVALSQLNRGSEGNEPELHHLKESGAIEEDADTVILLHPMRQEADGSLLILAKVAKNRGGRRGRIALSFDGRTQRWAPSCASVARATMS